MTSVQEKVSVQEKIAEQIAALSPRVEDQVVEAMVERELKKRSDAIVQGMDMLSKLEADLRKLKPDQETYGPDNKLIAATYSKAKMNERKKLEERTAKAKRVLGKAIDNADFSDLYKFASGQDKDKSRDGDSDETADDASE